MLRGCGCGCSRFVPVCYARTGHALRRSAPRLLAAAGSGSSSSSLFATQIRNPLVSLARRLAALQAPRAAHQARPCLLSQMRNSLVSPKEALGYASSAKSRLAKLVPVCYANAARLFRLRRRLASPQAPRS